MDTLIITLHTKYCIVVALHSELCKIAQWMEREINNNNKVTSLRYVGYIAHRTLLDLTLNHFEPPTQSRVFPTVQAIIMYWLIIMMLYY